MTIRVADILRHKGNRVVTTSPLATVHNAVAMMVENNVGSILVVQDGALCGVFTERDYLRRIMMQGRTSQTTIIEEVMTSDVVWADPQFTVQECLATMTEKKCRHLPIIDNEQLVGIVSIGDCVKELLGEAEARVQYLTAYISGQYPA